MKFVDFGEPKKTFAIKSFRRSGKERSGSKVVDSVCICFDTVGLFRVFVGRTDLNSAQYKTL